MERLLCLLVGYVLGSFLTAEAVARCVAGKSAFSIGTQNPGMANITAQLGLRYGLLTLAGDLGKTGLACLLCRFALAPALGQIAVLWAGLGAVLGHDFPVWNRFRGGKGVAVSCACFALFSLLGGVCCLLGGAVTLATGYLPLGAVLIPCAFVLAALVRGGAEGAAVAALIAALAVSRHYSGLLRIARGEEKRLLRRVK